MKAFGFGLGFPRRKSQGGSTPTPTELFIPLSWTGAKVVEYDFSIDSNTPTNYNKINRDGTPQSFNMGIFSNETFTSDVDVYLVGVSISYSAGN